MMRSISRRISKLIKEHCSASQILIVLTLGMAVLVGCTEYSYPQKVTINGSPTVEGTTQKNEPDSVQEEEVVVPQETDAHRLPEFVQETPANEDIAGTDQTVIEPLEVEEVESVTITQSRAVQTANARLDTGWYTKDSMIEALIQDGFSYDDALYGAEHCYIELG